MLLLVILKKSRYSSENPSIFFQQKTKFWTFREKLTYSVAFCIKLAASSGLQKNSKFFFRKTSLFLSRRSHFSNVLRDLTNSVASYNNYFYLQRFLKKSIFFREKPIYITWKTNFWRFWELLFIQSQCTASLLPLAIFL